MSWFALFKHEYTLLFQTQVEPVLGNQKLSASDRRVLVTRLVAEAHKRALEKSSPRLYESFRSLGYLPVADHSVIKPHPVPGYVFAPLTQIEAQVQREVAARESASAPVDEASSSNAVRVADLGKRKQPQSILQFFKKPRDC